MFLLDKVRLTELDEDIQWVVIEEKYCAKKVFWINKAWLRKLLTWRANRNQVGRKAPLHK